MARLETRFKHFCESDCNLLKMKWQGKTVFMFDLSYEKVGEDEYLVVRSDNTVHTVEEMREIFIHCCMLALADCIYIATK